MSERTEQPTQKKRREALEKGQVARSKEINTALLLLAGAWVVGPAADGLAAGLTDLFARWVTQPTLMPTDPLGASRFLQDGIAEVMGLLALPALVLAGITAFAGAVQARGVISLHPITPQWKRISPLDNAKRIFGAQAVAELLKSLFKLAIVVGALWIALAGSIEEILALSQQSPGELLGVVRTYAPRLLVAAGLAYMLLAAADYGFQLWQHEKGLRMSKQEVREEHKENEGDPMVKQRLRSMGRALTRNQMISSVAEADVVITNPTHIAVALKYDPSVAPAPVVVARGQRKIAQRIKKIAFESNVTVIEDKPLAWALYESTRVGVVIPAELYKVVAEVLAFVFRQRQRARALKYRSRSAEA